MSRPISLYQLTSGLMKSHVCIRRESGVFVVNIVHLGSHLIDKSRDVDVHMYPWTCTAAWPRPQNVAVAHRRELYRTSLDLPLAFRIGELPETWGNVSTT